MKGSLTLGITRNDDGEECLALGLGGKQCLLNAEQAMDLFNGIGEALEILGAFKECETCPNKDECDDYACGEEEQPCRLH